MPVPTKGKANTDGFQYEVSWKGDTIGWIKDADPSGLKPRSVEQRIGELNDILIDVHLRGGIDGTVKMTLHEVKAERIRQLMPWAAATGSFPISPSSTSFSCYDASGELRLHPIGAADTADDLVFLKAFPMISLPKNAGNSQRELPAEFLIFPDHTALTDTVSTNSYGYVGDPPVETP